MKVAKEQNIFSFALCALLLLPLSVPAQDLGEMVFTSGTTWRDGSDQDWAYLVWQATDVSLLMGQSFAIYRKAGTPSTSGDFERIGITIPQTDPRAIESLLRRASHLGEDEAELESVITQLFQDAVPAASLTLPEKIAAVMIGACSSPALYQNAVFLGRKHPAVALALGTGYAIPINAGFTTFEIRLYDPVSDQAGAVAGRVTLEANNPVVLPAPAELAHVEDDSPQGNMNIKLQWRPSDDLRRLSLLQYGYNLYRMTFDYAATHGYDLIPPNPETLLALAETTSAVRVNFVPILIDEDGMTTNTFFAVDDNTAGAQKGLTFADGDSFVYFVTARDLLGRDGLVSTGLVVMACDRMPPRVPASARTSIEYTYDGTTGTQAVKVVWSADSSTNLADRAMNYYVYRWTSIEDMQANAGDPLYGRIAGPLPHTPGRMSYTDTTLSEADKGITYWYTIRAADDGACGENLSGNSAPAHGTLRDRQGPRDRPANTLWINCANLETAFDTVHAQPETKPYLIYLRAQRNTNWIEWVEFAWYEGPYQGGGSETNATKLGRFSFKGPSIKIPLDIPHEEEQRQITVFCRAGASFGKVSPWHPFSGSTPANAHAEWRFVNIGSINRAPVSGPCGTHVGRPDPSSTPSFGEGILLESDMPSDGAAEWRFYRRIGYGPMTLIAQGNAEGILLLSYEDVSTMHDDKICYFVQFFDEHGNAGPLTQMGCVQTIGLINLATPMLQPLAATGEETVNPGFDATWFCSPAGVDHFEVAIARNDGTAAASPSDDLSTNTLGETVQRIEVTLPDDSTSELAFGIYRTGRIGAKIGSATNPLFSVSLEAELGQTYYVMVRARGANGGYGDWSEVETFQWTPYSALSGPEVPWPPRPLPEVASNFNTRITAHYLEVSKYPVIGHDRVALLIGEMPVSNFTGRANYSKQGETYYVDLHNAQPPAYYLFTGPDAESLMPFALYRQAVSNETLPIASGDIYQVSPLMESIAYQTNAPPDNITLRDPFIMVLKTNVAASHASIFMLDTQPVVGGASYKHSLLRFGEDREIESIIPVLPIQIPE